MLFKQKSFYFIIATIMLILTKTIFLFLTKALGIAVLTLPFIIIIYLMLREIIKNYLSDLYDEPILTLNILFVYTLSLLFAALITSDVICSIICISWGAFDIWHEFSIKTIYCDSDSDVDENIEDSNKYALLNRYDEDDPTYILNYRNFLQEKGDMPYEDRDSANFYHEIFVANRPFLNSDSDIDEFNVYFEKIVNFDLLPDNEKVEVRTSRFTDKYRWRMSEIFKNREFKSRILYERWREEMHMEYDRKIKREARETRVANVGELLAKRLGINKDQITNKMLLREGGISSRMYYEIENRNRMEERSMHRKKTTDIFTTFTPKSHFPLNKVPLGIFPEKISNTFWQFGDTLPLVPDWKNCFHVPGGSAAPFDVIEFAMNEKSKESIIAVNGRNCISFDLNKKGRLAAIYFANRIYVNGSPVDLISKRLDTSQPVWVRLNTDVMYVNNMAYHIKDSANSSIIQRLRISTSNSEKFVMFQKQFRGTPKETRGLVNQWDMNLSSFPQNKLVDFE